MIQAREAWHWEPESLLAASGSKLLVSLGHLADVSRIPVDCGNGSETEVLILGPQIAVGFQGAEIGQKKCTQITNGAKSLAMTLAQHLETRSLHRAHLQKRQVRNKLKMKPSKFAHYKPHG